MGRGLKGREKRRVVVHEIGKSRDVATEYDADTDEHGRLYYEGIMCYEADTDGTLTLYADRGDGESVEVTIFANDVARLMYAAIDALKNERSRR